MRPKRAVRHRPAPRQHSRRQRKMKVKKSEIQLLIAVIGVLIAVCTYFLVYSKFNEKSDALEAQNVTLSSQVATLEALDQRKADYIEATGKMQSYITNFENRFPADILPEDSIMMVKTLEDYTRTEVANIAFGSEAEVVYTPAADAATTTADATAATAIAEDVMELFEAHTLEEMADTYEAATPTGFTNSVQKDASLDVDGDGTAEDGIWQYTFRDEKTTSGTYDVVVTLDPNGYTALNEKDIVNIQNLAGNLNAVYSESEDAAQEAYGYFEAYSGGRDVMEIARNTTKTIEISIDSSRILLDLGDGESVETDVYLVTASTVYHCNSAILTGISGDYPQNGTDYVIFSNEEAVRAKAAELKKQKESGNPVDSEEIISQLANIIVCLQPRVEATQSIVTSAVDKVIVNNPKNVQTNLFLVEQTPSAERIDSFADESTGFNPYSSWDNNYKAAFELRETWPGWMSSAGASIDSACRLRTNLVKRSNTEYIFNDLSVSGAAGNATGDVAKDIMGADGGLTPTERRNRIYDMRVQVYVKDMIGVQSPVLTMTGTVIE
mgnify:CR=1 FL=1